MSCETCAVKTKVIIVPGIKTQVLYSFEAVKQLENIVFLINAPPP